jgi:hypothetical protein
MMVMERMKDHKNMMSWFSFIAQLDVGAYFFSTLLILIYKKIDTYLLMQERYRAL